MIRPHRACGIVMLTAALFVAGAPVHARAPEEDPTALLSRADAAHEQGRTAEAADLYVRAYKAMSADQRAMLGEIVVLAALDDLKATWELTDDPKHVREAAALYDAFASDVKGELPSDVAAHRNWIDRALAMTDDANGDPTQPFEPGRGDRRTGSDDDAPRSSGKREIVGPVLIGVGAAVAATGVGLVIGGVRAGPNADEQLADLRQHPDYLDLPPTLQQGWDADVDRWNEREHARGRSLAIAGGVLIGVGIGVATYGIVRLVQHKKKAQRTAVVPIPGGLAF